MKIERGQSGFSLPEVIVSMALLAVAFSAAAPLLVQSTQLNKAEEMRLAMQADARNCTTIIVNVLRTAGWDPQNTGFSAVGLDSDPNGTDNYIEVYADLNGDGDTLDQDEKITIQHHQNRLEWRRVADPNQPFVVLAENITDDKNGDGIIEPLFTPDSTTNPTKILVTITAQSSDPDPRTHQFIRYTVSSEVVLRANL